MERPKIKLTLSPFDKALELIGKIFLLILWALSIYIYWKSPEIIPIHYDGLGQPNGYGDKSTIFLISGIATILYLGITQLNKFPQIFNYPTAITEDNAPQQYGFATRMLRIIKLAILIIFSLMMLMDYLTIIGVTKGLGSWFLPLTFCILIIPTILSIILSLKHTKINQP